MATRNGWRRRSPRAWHRSVQWRWSRFDKPVWLTGSAARAAAKRLRAKGHPLVASPESFFVTHAEGPLADHELNRARVWGRALGAFSRAAAST